MRKTPTSKNVLPWEWKKKISWLLPFIMCSFFSFAQAQTVTGRVTDVNGGPIPGVNIIVKGTTLGTTTDANGEYSLSVESESKTLVFTFIGYIAKEVAVNNQSVIDVSLEADLTMLEEVVVVGYGTLQKKDLTGAVSQVKAAQLENENPNAVQDILRGNIAGLNVGMSTSAKGGGTLQVRGRQSLNANTSPLLVLDGAIYYGELSDINPNDIETIDVLKDGSAAAVFGAKAAAGVILITTKKGKEGKTTVGLNSNVGLATMAVQEPVYGPDEFVAWRTDVFNSIDVDHELHRYGDPRNLPEGLTLDQWLAYDKSTGDPVTVWLQRLNMQPVEIANYNAGNSVNWYNKVFQQGFRQDHTVSLSSRNDQVSYYMSLGYLNNEGIVVGDEFSTVRSRINIEGKVNKFLTIGMNTQFSVRDESQVPVNWAEIRALSPWGSEFDEAGNYKFKPNDESSGGHHPLLAPSATDRLQKITTLNSTVFAKVDLPFGITYQVNFTPHFEFYDRFNHESVEYEDWANIGGRASRQNRKTYYWQVDNLLKWNKTINKIHSIDVTLLANSEKYQRWDNTMTNTGFDPHDRLGYHNIGAGTNPIISSDDEYSTGDALMTRLFYSLKDRYIVTLSTRRDGYSAFGQKNPRALFTSAALGWVFTEEEFFKASWLDFGKLRASYGTNGNRDIGRYASLANLQTGKYLQVENDGTVNQVSQLYVNNMANENLKWERTTSRNIGLDFSTFNGVFGGTIELYRHSTKDLLVQRSLPDILGFDWVWDNLGEVQNKGIEISLNSVNLNTNNFIWRSTVNFQLNRNKIVHLYGDMKDVLDDQGNVIGQAEVDDFENQWFIGHAIDEIWDIPTDGIWQSDEASQASEYGVVPGDFKVVDKNGDGLYTRDDKEFIGYREPRFRWTFRNEFNLFKNFDLSFMVYSYWGHKYRYNQAKNRDGFLDRTNSHLFPYWTPENPQNEYARLYSSDGGASFNLYKAKSFIRLDNVSVAYTVPPQVLEKARIENLKLYFNVRNAAVYAPEWSYWDPEWQLEPDDLGPGPTPRTYTLGLNITL
jgi:TonB-linked SusC/RagA family outer membrane protein